MRASLLFAFAASTAESNSSFDSRNHELANSGAIEHATSGEVKGAALLARPAELLTAIDTKVAELKDKIAAVKRREEDIQEHIPKQWQYTPLLNAKDDLAALEAELAAAESEEAKEKESEQEKGAAEEEKKMKKPEAEEGKADHEEKTAVRDAEPKKTNRSSVASSNGSTASHSTADRAEANAGTLLLASAGPVDWGHVSVCFSAAVSVLSLATALRRQPVNVDQQPLLG
jgi:hypothetical protein